MTKLSQRYPPTPRPYAEGQNLEIGLAELMQQSAGMCATLEGHTNGAETVAGLANPAPRNGAGTFGHDHSGGENGRALFRSVASLTFAGGRRWNLSDINAGEDETGLYVPDGVLGTLSISSGQGEASIFVPPCDPVEGAYVNLAFVVTLYMGSTTLIASDDVNLRIWRRKPGGANVVRTVAIADPDVIGEKVCASGADTLLPVQPGAFNLFAFDVHVQRAASGSLRGAAFVAHEFELGVYES